MKPERDTSTRSGDEIVRRLMYLLFFTTAVVGGGLLVAAAVKKNIAFAIAGVVVVGLNLVLHRLGRRRLRFDDLKREIRANPFKHADAADRHDSDKAG